MQCFTKYLNKKTKMESDLYLSNPQSGGDCSVQTMPYCSKKSVSARKKIEAVKKVRMEQNGKDEM